MATYSPLFGTYSLQVDRNPLERAVTRLMKKMGKRQELMLTLNGATAGSAALSSRKRVAHSTTELGGVRSVEAYNEVNRVTTATDKTHGDNLLSKSTRIATPTNKAGSFDA